MGTDAVLLTMFLFGLEDWWPVTVERKTILSSALFTFLCRRVQMGDFGLQMDQQFAFKLV